MTLARYEAARTALAEASRIDEVKDLRDKAEALAAYARQAKDTQLVEYASEIKVRAERRCGELLLDALHHGGRAVNGDNQHTSKRTSNDATSSPPTLAELGLTRDQSGRYMRLAVMPEDYFDTAITVARATAGSVTTAHMLREAKQSRRPKDADVAEPRKELGPEHAIGASPLASYLRLMLHTLRQHTVFTEQERELLAEALAAIQHACRSCNEPS